MELHPDLERIKENSELTETIARKIVGSIQQPKFGIGGVPTKLAAKVYGKSELWVRTGIEEGWLPIGVAKRQENKLNVYISPKLLYEHTGYVFENTVEE